MPLEGNLVRLREERLEDLPAIQALRNDMRTQAWSQALPPDYTMPMYRQRFEERRFSYQRSDGRFVIEHKAEQAFAGFIVYSGLQPRWAATIGLVVAPQFWDTGTGYDAQETLLRFLFLDLGLRVVRLWTQSGNPHAISLAQRTGFQISVRQRESVIFRGQMFDNLGMDLLRPEYFARHPDLLDLLPSYSQPTKGNA
ncbi:MAG: hypothetical protein Fur0018_05460 [Anaerolineales bacterium]